MANTFNFFINIEIGGNTIRLDGQKIAGAVADVKNAVTNGFHVEYHADSFDDAFSLGTLSDGAKLVSGLAASLDPNFTLDVSGSITGMVSGTPLAGVVTAVTNNAELRITDIVIDTGTKTYKFGLGIDLGNSVTLSSPLTLGLRSFGFVVTHTS